MRQESERKSNQVEESKANERRGRIEIIRRGENERGIGDSGHKEWGRCPRKALYDADEREFRKVTHLFVAHLVDDLLKRNLPTVELDHFDAVQNLIDQLEPQVLIVQLFHVECLVEIGGDHVQRNEYDRGGEAGYGCYAQIAPQHVDADDYLKRRRPEHVEEGRDGQEELCVDGH